MQFSVVPHLTYIFHLLLWRCSDSLTSWKFIWSRKKLSLECDVGNAHSSELNSPSPWWAAPQLQMLNSPCRKISAPGDPNPSEMTPKCPTLRKYMKAQTWAGKCCEVLLKACRNWVQQWQDLCLQPWGWDEVKEQGGTAKDIPADRGAGPHSIWATPWAAHKYLLKWFSVWEQVEGQAGK